MRINHYIIHGFALAHLLIAILFHLLGWTDDFVMTFLTMSLVFTLSLIHQHSSAEAAMLSLIYICVGYFIGSQGADILSDNLPDLPHLWPNALMTFLLTEMFGWLTIIVYGRPQAIRRWNQLSRKDVITICLLFVIVLLYRIVYVDLVSLAAQNASVTFYEEMLDFGNHPMFALFSTVASVLGAHWIGNIYPYRKKPAEYFLCLLLLSIIAAIPPTLYSQFHVFHDASVAADYWKLLLFFLVAGLCSIFCCVASAFIFTYVSVSRQLRVEVVDKQQAQYQYHHLKQQLNPHFLFNCFNILDYIVQSGEADRASNFIRKLASVYRYQLSMGDRREVSIEEEINHVHAYVDLLQERFGEAFQVDIEVPQEYKGLNVVPCSIQLMVENAQKHNKVSQTLPLKVRIYIEDVYICVSNNIQERSSKPESTGIGLKNITQQYAYLTKTPVVVNNDGVVFTVKLPIL